MQDTTIPFPQTLDIPAEDFELFVGLNSNSYAEKQLGTTRKIGGIITMMLNCRGLKIP
jgi:hypothetical protein